MILRMKTADFSVNNIGKTNFWIISYSLDNGITLAPETPTTVSKEPIEDLKLNFLIREGVLLNSIKAYINGEVVAEISEGLELTIEKDKIVNNISIEATVLGAGSFSTWDEQVVIE